MLQFSCIHQGIQDKEALIEKSFACRFDSGSFSPNCPVFWSIWQVFQQCHDLERKMSIHTTHACFSHIHGIKRRANTRPSTCKIEIKVENSTFSQFWHVDHGCYHTSDTFPPWTTRNQALHKLWTFVMSYWECHFRIGPEGQRDTSKSSYWSRTVTTNRESLATLETCKRKIQIQWQSF